MECADNAAVKAAESKISELEKNKKILAGRQIAMENQSKDQITTYANLLDGIPQEALPEVATHVRTIRYAHGKSLQEKIKEVYKGKFHSSIWEKAISLTDSALPKLPEEGKQSILEKLRTGQAEHNPQHKNIEKNKSKENPDR